MDTYSEIEAIARAARAASSALAMADAEMRSRALGAMAAALRQEMELVLRANAEDVERARAEQVRESLIDRLMLDSGRIEEMACALEDLMELPDPVGRVLEERVLCNGLELSRVSVPLGVVAVIYEARPNVTADAAGICLKSGNACILRGGSMAAASCAAIAGVLADAVASVGLPRACVQAITTTDRAATDALMQLHGLIDVIVPRGGAGLIKHCVEASKVPVIETGTGNCHVYVHESAQVEDAVRIVENAKCRRYGVCNAAETLLIDRSCAERILPAIVSALAAHGVTMHMDPPSLQVAQAALSASGTAADIVAATDADWDEEYLAPEMAIACMDDVDAAIQHINAHGTGHSEAIVAMDAHAIEAFLAGVDAAAVYANASTAFTDGGQFGLGAEIGISTQKLHARGPFATDALTSYKYVIRGCGQVRS